MNGLVVTGSSNRTLICTVSVPFVALTALRAHADGVESSLPLAYNICLSLHFAGYL